MLTPASGAPAVGADEAGIPFPDGPAVLPLVELLLFPEFTVPEVSVLPVVGVVEVVVPVVPVVPEATPGPPEVIVPEVAFPVPEVPG